MRVLSVIIFILTTTLSTALFAGNDIRCEKFVSDRLKEHNLGTFYRPAGDRTTHQLNSDEIEKKASKMNRPSDVVCNKLNRVNECNDIKKTLADDNKYHSQLQKERTSCYRSSKSADDDYKCDEYTGHIRSVVLDLMRNKGLYKKIKCGVTLRKISNKKTLDKLEKKCDRTLKILLKKRAKFFKNELLSIERHRLYDQTKVVKFVNERSIAKVLIDKENRPYAMFIESNGRVLDIDLTDKSCSRPMSVKISNKGGLVAMAFKSSCSDPRPSVGWPNYNQKLEKLLCKKYFPKSAKKAERSSKRKETTETISR